MTLSIDTQSGFPSETLSVRTHSFVRRFMVEPSILPTNLCEDPGQGVDPRTIPLMHNGVISVDEVSHTNKSKLHDYAFFPYVVNVVAPGKIGFHSTRTLCIFHKHHHFSLFHSNTDISVFHKLIRNFKRSFE